MALIHLSWDNSILTTPNELAYRASKRVKTVGGAFSTAGFSPANDMSLSIGATDATVTANKVYEFKLEMICASGGPTISPNGIQEWIAFSCLAVDLTSDDSHVSAHINVFGTDITKARLTLKRASDNTIVGGPVIVNNVADAIDHTFSGLASNTAYYIEIEYYATVNGGDVISSDALFLGSPCGGNTSGYQIDTSSACVTLSVAVESGTPTVEWVTCDLAILSSLVGGGGLTICTDGTPIIVTGGTVITDIQSEGDC